MRREKDDHDTTSWQRPTKSNLDATSRDNWAELCPILNLTEYLNRIDTNVLSDDFIFRAIINAKRFERLRKANSPISYSTIREHFVFILQSIGLDSKLYGLHSLRSGGASAAANMGVEDRLIQKHGRWKTVGVKNRYISEDIDNLLFIS